MEKEPRTYTSAQLTKKLQQERLVDLSSDRLRRLLKKNYRWKRTRQSHRHNQDSVKKALKQADLDTLKLATLSDCCFILKMTQNFTGTNSQLSLDLVSYFAKKHNLKMVAKRVSYKDISLLLKAGIDYVQGYEFGKPELLLQIQG